MRKDMFEVIVERPRAKSRNRFSDVRHNRKLAEYLEDSTVSKHGMRKLVTVALGWDRKSLNENLQPLIRYLSRHIGQPWDMVFSEICERINTNNTVQKHVRDHIRDYVEIDFRYQNGSRFGDARSFLPMFYVDESGILRTNLKNGSTKIASIWHERYLEGIERRKKEKDAIFRKIGDEEIWKIDGIWYSPIWDVARLDYMKLFFEDIFTKKTVKLGERYRAGKRQVDKKTLRRFGVAND